MTSLRGTRDYSSSISTTYVAQESVAQNIFLSTSLPSKLIEIKCDSSSIEFDISSSLSQSKWTFLQSCRRIAFSGGLPVDVQPDSSGIETDRDTCVLLPILHPLHKGARINQLRQTLLEHTRVMMSSHSCQPGATVGNSRAPHVEMGFLAELSGQRMRQVIFGARGWVRVREGQFQA